MDDPNYLPDRFVVRELLRRPDVRDRVRQALAGCDSYEAVQAMAFELRDWLIKKLPEDERLSLEAVMWQGVAYQLIPTHHPYPSPHEDQLAKLEAELHLEDKLIYKMDDKPRYRAI